MLLVGTTVVLGLAWAIVAGLKLADYRSFREDVEGLIGKTAGAMLTPLIIATEVAAGVMLIIRQAEVFAAQLTIAMVIIFTASYVLRAVKKRNLTCTCFGIASRSVKQENGLLSLRSVIKDSLQGAWIFSRNGIFIVCASLVAGLDQSQVAVLVGVNAVLIMAATALEIYLEKRDMKQRPHPALSDLLTRRRMIFATDWYSGVWTSWISCFVAKKA